MATASGRMAGRFRAGARGACGRCLTGERAHYELAAGKDIAPLIETYERFATWAR